MGTDDHELVDQTRAKIRSGESPQLKKLYKGLKTLRGFGAKGVKDAAATIDKVLYG